MFYSRRIGLSGGQEVPILAAGKLSGRTGPYSVGVMNVQTEATDLTLPDRGETHEPSTNYAVIRVKRDLFTNSSVGAIFTNNQSSNSDFSRLFGIDGNLWFNSSLKGEVLLARTFNPEGVAGDSLGIGRLIFSQDDITADLRYYAVGPEFVPEMGFVIQNDLRRASIEGGYTQWINQGGVRSIEYSGTFTYDTLYEHDFYGQRGTAGVRLNLESNDNFGYFYGPARERIYEPFIVGPIEIQRGDYSNRTHDIQFQSDATRPISIDVDYRIMDYWTGDRQQLLISNNFHPTAHLSIDFIYTYNTVDHSLESFDTTTLSNRILYAFTTELFVKSYIQWNNLENRFSANFLAGWEYRPGSEVYIVYNEIRDRFESPTLAPRDRLLLLKWTYNFRF